MAQASFFSRRSFLCFLGGIPLGIVFYLPYEISQSQKTGRTIFDLYFKEDELNEKAARFARSEVEEGMNDTKLKMEAENSIEMEENIQNIFKTDKSK